MRGRCSAQLLSYSVSLDAVRLKPDATNDVAGIILAEKQCRLPPRGDEMTRRTFSAVVAAALPALLLTAGTSPASAQLTVAKDAPVVYGHHHLNTTNMDAQKKFFIETLGGTLVKVGTNKIG